MHRRGYRSDWRTRPAKKMIPGMKRNRLLSRGLFGAMPDPYVAKLGEKIVELYTASSFAVAMQARYIPEKVFTNAVCGESNISAAFSLRQTLQELKETLPPRTAEDEIFEHLRLIGRRIEYRLLDSMMKGIS